MMKKTNKLVLGYIQKSGLAKKYLLASVVVVLGTTVLWSVQGALIHSTNSDQLVNSLLFKDWPTFNGAVFPGAHTFILKWPIFFVIAQLGNTRADFVVATVLLSLLTVSGILYILHKIEKRPLLLASYYMLLASILLYIPAQPYAGGLLPVNFAMIATRNIEYLVYIAGFYALIKAKRANSKAYISAICIFGILFASDRLFFSIGLGSCILALFIYMLLKRKAYSVLAARALIAIILGMILAQIVVWLITASHLTNISSDGLPYGIVQNPRQVALGLIFGILGILTNLGSNPIFDIAVFKAIPVVLQKRLVSIAIIGYATNIIAALGIGYLGLKRLKTSILKDIKTDTLDAVEELNIYLIWSSIAAFCLFVISNHYYVVDSRYLAIYLPTSFIVLASQLRKQKYISAKLTASVAGILFLSIASGIYISQRTYNTQLHALNDINSRDQIVISALKSHPTQVLVGDYWRVFPLKQQIGNIVVTPLESCANVRHILSSKAFEPNLKNKSFAYLVSLDKSLTNFKGCSLAQISAMYGLPNKSIVISGTISNPKELLLFYESGSSPQKQTTDLPDSVAPLTLDKLAAEHCENGNSILNIVAHQDDDLLFMSPDLIHDLNGLNNCVNTVFLTAGDAGDNKQYWLSREYGSEAAYNVMLNNTQPWVETVVKTKDGQYVTVASLKDKPKVKLVFLRLPDGNINGQGFNKTKSGSLARLESGFIPSIHSVDGQSEYTRSQLMSTLAQLVDTFKPTEIHTQYTHDESNTYHDHSDHKITGEIATRALTLSTRPETPVIYYSGYGITRMQPNVSGSDLDLKASAFFAYAKYDSGVCKSLNKCDNPGVVYGKYLRRQYSR